MTILTFYDHLDNLHSISIKEVSAINIRGTRVWVEMRKDRNWFISIEVSEDSVKNVTQWGEQADKVARTEDPAPSYDPLENKQIKIFINGKEDIL